MPVMSSKLCTLSLLHNLSPSMIGSSCLPKERQINRSILLDVSPDREELLSNNSIEDIRERLKLCVPRPHNHWLYRIDDRSDTKPACGEASNRNSPLNRIHDKENAPEDHEFTSCGQTLSSPNPDSGTVILERESKDVANTPKKIWSSRSLSTMDKLISPRPLGPTHTLVVSQRCRDCNSDASSDGEDCIEIPINDLLFILNVPNLRTSRKNGRLASVLPRRSHKEIPRVALHVPFLDTFPEVVVYLHTKDKDVLFRQLIPGWIRDIVHPLTSAPSTGTRAPALQPLGDATIRVRNEDFVLSSSQCLSFLGLGLGLHVASIAKDSVKRLLRPISPILAIGHHPSSVKSAPDTSALALTPPDGSPNVQNDQRRKAACILAKELADAYTAIGFGPGRDITDLKMLSAAHPNDHSSEVNVLKLTADRLDALAANFTYLGYFERTMWTELDMYRDVIAEALILIPQQLDHRFKECGMNGQRVSIST